ncbi:MAG: AAA family ATPase [Chitinophagaceae bacterium]|nr:AAA family ATPase [Chitinophagaceae bacterium]
MPFPFNDKQQKVFNQLKAFVKDKTINTFILNGYAGTGKTFLVQYFAKYLKQKKTKFSLLATTGRAAAVLRGKTDLPTSTVHGALYSFTKVDGDDEDIPDDAPADAFGQMRLIFEPNRRLEEDCVYIVDEASMLASESSNESSFAVFGSGNLLPDLLRAIGNNKIIFVGDPCQLPPVHQIISPALDQDWLNNHGRIAVTATLDQIMRTNPGNDVLQVASDVRKSIGTIPSTKWIKLPAKNRTHCTVLPDGNTVFLEYFARFLQYGPKDSIAIAHSNAACNHLNKYFRKRLYPESNQLLEDGEILMVTQNNHIVPLTNGDFVKVIYRGEISIRANLKFQDVRIKHVDTEKEFQIKLALDPFANFAANLTIDQQRNLMIDFSRRMRRNGIKPKSDAYKEAMRKDTYLNSLRATYGYVVTCHKAQGGEWKDVFLFLDKKMYAYLAADEMRRWWYTAITRTKEHLYLHNDWWIC